MADETIILDDGTEIVIHARLGCTFGETPTRKAAIFDPFAKYDPAQPRDDWGRWTATGSGESVNEDIGIRTRADGGSTTDVSGKAGSGAVKSGKALSVHPERSRVYKTGARMNEQAIAAAVDRYRRDHHDLLSRSGYSLGTWLDSETGELWLDVITVVETSAQADSLARTHNQIAYYDIDSGKEVRTGGTGLAKHSRGLLGRLRGWLDAGGRGSAPVQDDGLGRHGDPGRDRGSPPRSVEPVVLSRRLTPRQAQILNLVEKRYNPNQPRHPKGHPQGGQWVDVDALEVGERIAPHYQQPYETPSGRGGVPENFDATRMSAMTDEFLATLDAKFEKHGIDDIPGDLVENLDMLMGRIKRDYPELVEIGEHWYAEAQARIAEHAAESGVPLDAAIGMTAAMSPNSEWGQNIALAGEMMRQLKADAPIVPTSEDMAWLRKKAKSPKGQNYAAMLERFENGETPRPSELSDIEAAVGVQLVGRRRQLVSENPTLKGTFGKVAFATGTANMAKAIAIHRGAEVDDVLGGHKVRSFYNNLSDPYDSRGVGDVTIDTHAASAAQLFRMPMTSKRADETVWTGASGASNQQGAYPIYADAFRAVARKHGMAANQAQAVLWVGWQQVRHEFPGIVVSEDAKTLASGLKQADVYGPARQSTIGRYGIQDSDTSLHAPPRYKSQVSKWQAYQDGQITWSEYAQYLAITPS